jgi:hypothetical protein
MSVSDLISLLKRRLVYLGNLRTSAVAIGDLEQVDRIDTESAEAQSTLNQLESL